MIEAEGGYDKVVYCTVCGKVLSRGHVTVPAEGPLGDVYSDGWIDAEDGGLIEHFYTISAP